MPLFETWLLYNYEMKTRIINGGLENIRLPSSDGNMEKNVLTRCRYLPWEKTRILRRFNWQLSYHLYTYAQQIVYQTDDPETVNMLKRIEHSEGIFDALPDEWLVYSGYLYLVDVFRLQLVHTALHLWYLEHDHTLPESLDELVGTYLDEIPRDPQTGAKMEYYPKGNESLLDTIENSYRFNHIPDCPYLKLETNILDLQFLPNPKTQSLTPNP
jgi:hypothetical protein